jgi:hypothetical protein
MDANEFLGAELTDRTVSERLRWTSDFLDLAGKAISIVACAQGLDCPLDLHHAVQRDLRAWARYLEDRPLITADLEMASGAAHCSQRPSIAEGGR